MTKKIVFAALLILSPITYGATQPATEPAPKLYEIEVMVFQNIRPDLEGNELWVNERVDPEIEDLDKAVAITTAPNADSDMTKAREALEQDTNYRVLVHKQWVQNADARSEAELVRLNNEDGELDGTFKFFVSRFLHVDLNLLLKETELTSMFQAENPVAASTINYEIREKRRVRSNELQYFDHPKFGVLMLVKQVENDSN